MKGGSGGAGGAGDAGSNGGSDGTSGSAGGTGGAFGAGIFLDGMTAGGGGGVEVLTLGTGQTTGQITTISGDIADNAGSVSGAGGQGALVIQGAGTVVLSGDNNYSGGTTIKGGVLELNSAHAPGTGTITFATNGGATLQIDNPALTSGALTDNNAIAGFVMGDAIDFRGLTYSSGMAVTYNSSTGQMTVGGDRVTLSTGNSPWMLPAGDTLAAVEDAAGGTEVELCILLNPGGAPITTIDALNTAIVAADGEAAEQRHL